MNEDYKQAWKSEAEGHESFPPRMLKNRILELIAENEETALVTISLALEITTLQQRVSELEAERDSLRYDIIGAARWLEAVNRRIRQERAEDIDIVRMMDMAKKCREVGMGLEEYEERQLSALKKAEATDGS